MEYEPILQMGIDKMIPRFVYQKPFTVKFPHKCKWQNGFNADKKGGLVWYEERSKTNKVLVLGCTNVAQEGRIASAFGYTPPYSRLKYAPLRHG
jgi:hypothetical protein